MNEKKAKALRKEIYGDVSLKIERTYTRVCPRVNAGKRGEYRLAKIQRKMMGKEYRAEGLLFEVNG